MRSGAAQQHYRQQHPKPHTAKMAIIGHDSDVIQPSTQPRTEARQALWRTRWRLLTVQGGTPESFATALQPPAGARQLRATGRKGRQKKNVNQR
jgi:hypothetical protein